MKILLSLVDQLCKLSRIVLLAEINVLHAVHAVHFSFDPVLVNFFLSALFSISFSAQNFS